MTDGWGDPDEQQARDIEEHLKEDDPRLHRLMSRSAVPWIITRGAIGALLTLGGLALLAYGSSSLGIGAVVFGVILVFIGGYETATRVMQLRRRIREG